MPLVPLDTTTDLAALTAALCDIASVSGDEAAIADAVEATLRAAGHLEVTRDGDAVVARTLLGRPQRVVIAGHLDTVPINGNWPTTREVRDGADWIVGRGTVDMKAGVAVALKAAVELTAPRHDVTWVFYDHEEVSAALNGLGRLVRTHPDLLQADFAVLGEPTSAAIEGGCNGSLRVRLDFTGARAHSARPWMGSNAIHSASAALSALAAYEPETIEVDGLAYRESLNAVGIQGGIAGNVIPDLATITVNYRFAPCFSGDEALERLRSVVGDDVTIVVEDLAPGARPGLTLPAAQEFLAAVDAPVGPKYGWTDVARFSELGIPAVNYGPGDPSLAHRDDEAVPVADIIAVDAGLRAWLSA